MVNDDAVQSTDGRTALSKLDDLSLGDCPPCAAPARATTGKVKAKKGGNKKGANPIKARLKGSSCQTDSAPVDSSSDGPPFAATVVGPIVTLQFSSRATQHRALARVETYYEGVDPKLAGFQSWTALQKTFGGESMPWAVVAERHLCRGYEAFNLPLDIVRKWVDEMRSESGSHAAHDTQEDPKAWLKACCLKEEVSLLEYLEEQGVISLNAGTQEATQPSISQPPQYLISTTLTSRDTALLHERLHALYHLSPHFASEVHSQYTIALSKKSLKVIEHDLKMRGYRDSVWQDEWQAYLLGSSAGDVEGPGEATWGKGPREECLAARDVLRNVARSEGDKFGVKMPW